MSNYYQIRDIDTTNGLGIGVAVFLSGCHFGCPNCFNQNLWDFNCGKPITDDVVRQIVKYMSKNYITRFSVLGGEPLADENYETTFQLIKTVKSIYPDKLIWLWTGYTFENLLDDDRKKSVLKYIDCMIDGKFIDNLKDFKLQFRGSSNQKLINVQRSLEQNKIVEYQL